MHCEYTAEGTAALSGSRIAGEVTADRFPGCALSLPAKQRQISSKSVLYLEASEANTYRAGKVGGNRCRQGVSQRINVQVGADCHPFVGLSSGIRASRFLRKPDGRS